MRYVTRILLLGSAALVSAGQSVSTAVAAPLWVRTNHSTHVFSPVVVEWFSLSRPRVGQHETVYARLLNGNKPVSRARLTATISRGRTVLFHLQGGMTDRTGKARADFTVPSSMAGKTVQVGVVMSYRGSRFPGRNVLRILP